MTCQGSRLVPLNRRHRRAGCQPARAGGGSGQAGSLPYYRFMGRERVRAGVLPTALQCENDAARGQPALTPALSPKEREPRATRSHATTTWPEDRLAVGTNHGVQLNVLPASRRQGGESGAGRPPTRGL